MTVNVCVVNQNKPDNFMPRFNNSSAIRDDSRLRRVRALQQCEGKAFNDDGCEWGLGGLAKISRLFTSFRHLSLRKASRQRRIRAKYAKISTERNLGRKK